MLCDIAQTYYFEENYNCAESILRAANEYYHLELHDRDMIMIGAMGGGIQTGNTCGAFIAAAAVLSMLYVNEKAHESPDISPAVAKLTMKVGKALDGFACCDIKPRMMAPGQRCWNTVEIVCNALEETVEEFNRLRG